MQMFGIPNCDTVKKARRWLDDNGIGYQFVDIRQNPVSDAQWQQWLAQFGLKLVNKSSTSWRNLSDEQKQQLSLESALTLLAQNPTLMKRPVLIGGPSPLLGFSADDYQHLKESQ